MCASAHVSLVEEIVEPQAASPKRKFTQTPGQGCFLETFVDCRLRRRLDRGIPKCRRLGGKRFARQSRCAGRLCSVPQQRQKAFPRKPPHAKDQERIAIELF